MRCPDLGQRERRHSLRPRQEGVRGTTRSPTAITIRPKAQDARRVIRLALELMVSSHRSWLGIPSTLAMIVNCGPEASPCQGTHPRDGTWVGKEAGRPRATEQAGRSHPPVHGRHARLPNVSPGGSVRASRVEVSEQIWAVDTLAEPGSSDVTEVRLLGTDLRSPEQGARATFEDTPLALGSFLLGGRMGGCPSRADGRGFPGASRHLRSLRAAVGPSLRGLTLAATSPNGSLSPGARRLALNVGRAPLVFILRRCANA